MKNVAYMMDAFPIVSETFIIHEILELKKRGLNIKIFAQYKAGDIPFNSFIHPESRQLIRDTYYFDPFVTVVKKKRQHLHTLLRRPVRYLRTFLYSYLKGGETFIAFKSAPLYIQEMQKYDIGHIHAHFARQACTMAMLVSMLTGIPYSFSVHAHDIYDSEAQDITNHIEHARFVATCTAYNKTFLIEKYGESARKKVRLNYHGVDSGLFTVKEKGNERSLSILSIGRLVEKKGYPYLIQAISLLRDNMGGSFSVNIIGDGPDYDSLRRLADEAGVPHLIYFRGALGREEIQKHFDEADIFVLPSIVAHNGDRDGIPNVILEAMSKGLPVVSTRLSGIPEVITDGVDGVLVPPGDSNALAEAIRKLHKDRHLGQRLGRNARKKIVDAFDKADKIDELLALFLNHSQTSTHLS